MDCLLGVNNVPQDERLKMQMSINKTFFITIEFIVKHKTASCCPSLNYKKEKRRLSPTLSGSPQAEYTMVQSAPVWYKPNCIFFCSFLFRGGDSRAIEQIVPNVSTRLPDYNANIVQVNEIMQILFAIILQ